MKGNMTEAPNTRTKKGRAQARAQGVPYDVVVNDIRYIWNPAQAERLATEIPENPATFDNRS